MSSSLHSSSTSTNSTQKFSGAGEENKPGSRTERKETDRLQRVEGVCRAATWRGEKGVRGHKKQGIYGSILYMGKNKNKKNKERVRLSGCSEVQKP